MPHTKRPKQVVIGGHEDDARGCQRADDPADAKRLYPGRSRFSFDDDVTGGSANHTSAPRIDAPVRTGDRVGLGLPPGLTTVATDRLPEPSTTRAVRCGGLSGLNGPKGGDREMAASTTA
jgi:hypothetical protein